MHQNWEVHNVATSVYMHGIDFCILSEIIALGGVIRYHGYKMEAGSARLRELLYTQYT